MPNKTKIEYCEYSSNPIYATFATVELTGAPITKRGHHCVHRSEGCRHCYAEAINVRFGTGLHFTAQNTDKIKFAISVKELEDLHKLDARLAKNGQWATCFVGDMTDLFQFGVPEWMLHSVFRELAQLKRIICLIFTKRADRLESYTHRYSMSRYKHLWFFVSVEDQKAADERVAFLMKADVAFRGVSIEPLLSKELDMVRWLRKSVDSLDYAQRVGYDNVGSGRKETIDWGLIGGESGSSSRAFYLSCARSVVAQFQTHGVPVFMKQVGKHPVPEDSDFEPGCWPTAVMHPANRQLRLTDSKGGTVSEWASDLRVRQFPPLKYQLQPQGLS